ncbi:hypothetical protein EK21DRAFT_107761 [Setomelanomma holmii]|uniref:Uncharacterized protein n=1 Tax=Setomelanomma holmii TaxID=210430 RepID=A0A9P4HG85_9PLEO|nr:hypothetical protein EK21DRAFT_107761 [Setomelanomma holmii]
MPDFNTAPAQDEDWTYVSAKSPSAAGPPKSSVDQSNQTPPHAATAEATPAQHPHASAIIMTDTEFCLTSALLFITMLFLPLCFFWPTGTSECAAPSQASAVVTATITTTTWLWLVYYAPSQTTTTWRQEHAESTWPEDIPAERTQTSALDQAETLRDFIRQRFWDHFNDTLQTSLEEAHNLHADQQSQPQDQHTAPEQAQERLPSENVDDQE